MASICDGAVCLGLSTDLNGSICLTNEVQCKDGKLTVPSQGSVLRRYATTGFAGFDLMPPGPVLLPGGAGLITVSGPRDAAGVDKLMVTVTNPFCARANVLINFEYAAVVVAAITDQLIVSGEVSIVGTNFVEDNVQPFNTANPQVAGPSAYGPITAYAQSPVGEADSGELYGYTHAGAFTVMAQLASLASCTFNGHARVDIDARGALRQVTSFNVAVTFTITPAL